MIRLTFFSACLFFTFIHVQAQFKKYMPADTNTLRHHGVITEMPYNRLIQSAGTVITYGDPQLENHTLDITMLPGKNFLLIEDRYGIAVMDSKSNEIKDRWMYNKLDQYKDLMSTYSGITSFLLNNKVYMTWGAVGKSKSYIMVAEWDGQHIQDVKTIEMKPIAPAKFALPNQVAVQFENNIPYLYIILNGNNQLLKMRFTDQQVIWTANTGVAPFGICIVQDKAFVTNWAGPLVTDTTRENAGTPWGSAYTNPATGATSSGSVSVINNSDGKIINEIETGLHPNAIISSKNNRYLYVANGNSDNISIIDVVKQKQIASIDVGLFSKDKAWFGSSPNALLLDHNDSVLYVANGLDNAIAVLQLTKNTVSGYIPTESYPSGIALLNNMLYITNLEAKGAAVLSNALYGNSNKTRLPAGKSLEAYSIHQQLASISIIPVPDRKQLNRYTQKVKELNLYSRVALANLPARKEMLPKPLPERTGEPSLFKHVIYIIKENKTYDQVFGDIKQGRGEERLCIYGDSITPNQHQLAKDFLLLDNYYASGKSSAEGHQWTDAAMVSDYIEKNVRAWFRSYPHRQEDALVYNRSGFIWNNALDHGKKVRVYGEACTTHYNEKLKWLDFYTKWQNNESFELRNTSTIARLRPIISPDYPDCDNINFPDQMRADIFIKDWKTFEQMNGDNLPDLMVLSLPNDHTAGTSPNFPTPRALVADNDLAVGRIVEAVTNSRFWDSTVIFITEDDSQSGWDHISPYRTNSLILSQYSVIGKTIGTRYNQTSVVRSIEQILGIPPMNIIDATALPMFDCFSNTKNNYRFTQIKNKVPLNEMNKSYTSLKGKALYYAKLSANSVYKEIDSGEDDLMNKVLWYNAKGTEPYPYIHANNKKN